MIFDQIIKSFKVTGSQIWTTSSSSDDFTQLETTVIDSPVAEVPTGSGVPEYEEVLETVRRNHRANPSLPLILLLQYSASVWISEIAYEWFPTSNMQHTVVRY